MAASLRLAAGRLHWTLANYHKGAKSYNCDNGGTMTRTEANNMEMLQKSFLFTNIRKISNLYKSGLPKTY